MTVETTTQDKQITIDVPEDRVAEFYAFYGRFLAGSPGRRRHRHGPHGRGHGCSPHRHDADADAAEAPERPAGDVPTDRPGPETAVV